MMKLVVLRQGHGLVGYPCRACPRKLLPGQTALWSEMKDAPLGRSRIFAVHVSCMRQMIRNAPDEVALSAAALRERILTSGDPFA